MRTIAESVTDTNALAAGPELQLASGAACPQEILRLVTSKLAEGRAGHFRFLCSRLRSREDAEDVLQEFAIKALQGANRLSDVAKVDAWLAVALRNALFDRYRRNASRTKLQEAVRAEPVAATHDDEDVDQPVACLSAALRTLRPETQALLRRAELQDMSLKLIADDLGITANNAGVRVHRARESLRQAMRERCSACQNRCPLAARFLERQAA